MFSLPPPPPRFTLPPPPIFDSKILFQLTCSSIQQQQTDPHLFLISCITFFTVTIFLTLLFIWIYRQKSLSNHLDSKSTSIIPRDSSICSSRSYATISSGIYLESIETNPNNIICNSPLYYDILPD
jgi:hypothetical protein